MVGLGETWDEIVEVLRDLRRMDCQILTIGQYLRPSIAHLPMTRYYTPAEFDELKRIALDLGFGHVESGPLVRSSYHAHEQADRIRHRAAAVAARWIRRRAPARSSARDVIQCERCPRLRAYCTQIAHDKRAAYRDEDYWARPVPGFGDPDARIVIVGLAPAAHGANRTGRMFTGDGTGGSGDFLMAALHANGLANRATSTSADDGLTLSDVWMTAAVRCAPPDNKPAPDEIAACQRYLVAELDALPRARVLVALGRLGFDACWRVLAERGVRPRIGPVFAHAALHEPPGGPAVIASYHPSRQNTHTAA